eukprot:scaffold15247_cov116-Skeletonema_marinoi.AAC.1
MPLPSDRNAILHAMQRNNAIFAMHATMVMVVSCVAASKLLEVVLVAHAVSVVQVLISGNSVSSVREPKQAGSPRSVSYK